MPAFTSPVRFVTFVLLAVCGVTALAAQAPDAAAPPPEPTGLPAAPAPDQAAPAPDETAPAPTADETAPAPPGATAVPPPAPGAGAAPPPAPGAEGVPPPAQSVSGIPGIGRSPIEFPKIPPPNPQAVSVPPGFTVELVAGNLAYPTSVDIDDLGAIYVAEGGYSYGDDVAQARILRINPLVPNQRQVVADQLNGPVNDIMWFGGRLYISHRGKISTLGSDGTVLDLVEGLPSLGAHQNNSMDVGPDGKIYFGQGTATNAGVVGVNDFMYRWLQKYPDFHDFSPQDVRLTGETFSTPDPLSYLTLGEARDVATSAFQPFGTAAAGGTVIPGQVKANGTILRMNPDGSNLEVYAWGLRNPFGIGFLPDGRLLATDEGYDDLGSRPIANAPDTIWNIRQGAWYGFPDFAAGIPVTDPRFQSERGPPAQFLLAEHPPVEQPFVTLAPHTNPTKFDVSPGGAFGARQVYVALTGGLVPVTGNAAQHSGFAVARLDLDSMRLLPFMQTQPTALGPTGFEHVATSGLKRPIDVKFSNDGTALYVVDFGAITTIPTALGAAPRPFPGTGALWRITPTAATVALPASPQRTYYRGAPAPEPTYRGVRQPVRSSIYSLGGTYLYPPPWYYRCNTCVYP